MQIQLRLMTHLKRYLPDHASKEPVQLIEIHESAVVKDVLETLGIPLDIPKVIMLNDRQGTLDHALGPGDRITLFPPVGGG